MLRHRSITKVRPSTLWSGWNCFSAPLTAEALGTSTSKTTLAPSSTYAATSLTIRSNPPIARQAKASSDPRMSNWRAGSDRHERLYPRPSSGPRECRVGLRSTADGRSNRQRSYVTRLPERRSSTARNISGTSGAARWPQVPRRASEEACNQGHSRSRSATCIHS